MSKILLTAAAFIVTVDALGLTSPGLPASMAKRGETVKGEHLGDEAAIQRLLDLGAIIQAPEAAPEAPNAAPGVQKEADVPKPEPEGPAARFAAGLTLPPDFVWTDEATAYVKDLKEGVVPVPFDADKNTDLTVKELVQRIEGVTGEPYAQGSKKKAEIVQDLKGFMEAYVAGLLPDEEEESGDDLPEGWEVRSNKDNQWEVWTKKDGQDVLVKGELFSREDAEEQATVLAAAAKEEGGLKQ